MKPRSVNPSRFITMIIESERQPTKEVIHLEVQTIEAVEPVRVPIWAWLVAAVAIMALYALTMANETVLAGGATVLHEFFHDARHFVSVPCH